MDLIVKPSPEFKGSIWLPASKSYSIRAFMVAACGGSSVIVRPSNCNDALVAMRVARTLGARIKRTSHASVDRWQVVAYPNKVPPFEINVRESGTVLRFLLPLIALRGKAVTVVGEGSLKGRPNLYLTRALRRRGVLIQGKGANESVPVRMRNGVLKGGIIAIDGSVSSQFISALLIACPQLPQDSHLVLRGKQIVSTDYITMTQQILRCAGIRIEQKSSRQYKIRGNQNFKGLKNFTVPSDYGLAAFHMAAAVLSDSQVTLKGCISGKFLQADGHIVPLLRKMGARISISSKQVSIKGPFALKGGVFSLKNCPDLVPVMCILALFARGRTRLTHIAHARLKESDRISDLRRELAKVGACIRETRDTLTVVPQTSYKQNRLLNPHNDHRLAMAFSVLGMKLGVRVKDIECTRKSYPNFVRDFKALGAIVRNA